MVPRDEYRLVIHNSVAWGMRRGYGGGFRDELVTQSLTTGTIVAASFDEVTEFGYFEYCGWLQVTRSRPVAGVMCLGYGDWPAALTQLRMIFTCLTSGNGAREPWGRRRA
jgi:hypothetical protein